MTKALFILLVIILFTSHNLCAYKVDLTVHNRVDTTNIEVKEVLNLWKNYLESKPDSIYNNPFWNEREKAIYEDFDFARAFMYPFDSEYFLQSYKPIVLSIEKVEDHYSIRTLFYAEGLEDLYKPSNPWCITKYYAIIENGEWKLKNAISVITKDWEKNTIGKIRFIFKKGHKFNLELAKKSNEFCENFIKKYEFPDFEPFDYYLCDSGDELGSLNNFDFAFSGYTTGIGLREKRILFSGIGSEYYPHEFIHLIMPNNERHWLIEEGFATLIGGANQNITFEANLSVFASEIDKNKDVTFDDILNRRWGHHCSGFYVTGAIICKAIYEKVGLKSFKEFLNFNGDNGELIAEISKHLAIDEKEFDSFLRNKIKDYLK